MKNCLTCKYEPIWFGVEQSGRCLRLPFFLKDFIFYKDGESVNCGHLAEMDVEKVIECTLHEPKETTSTEDEMNGRR